MKNLNQTILLLITFLLAFIIGNIISENLKIKPVIEKIFNKSASLDNINQKNQTPIKNTSPTSTSSKTNTIHKLPQTLIRKIGESYTLGNMKYKVISATNEGSKYEYSETKGKFISVKILVSNIGKTNSNGSKIIIKDKMDRQYQKEEYFIFSFNSDKKEYNFNVFDGGMAPGFSETYTAVFEVAKDSTDLNLCHPSTTGVDIVCVELGL
ncbi:MAG: DUF4352 domain-containing protein [Candidatus Pacebacteria bacterium]|nr:DUF4352 domain-containing protein [Candidatus Paceibacterota bacterium]